MITPNPIAGVGLHGTGALLAANCYAPQKFIKRWSWETFWIVQAAFCWLIWPIVGAMLTIPELGAVITEALDKYPKELAYSFLLSLAYGVGGIAFNYSIKYIGFALTYAIAIGLSSVIGTTIPPLVRGELMEKLAKPGAVWVIGGMLVGTLGIAFCGIAGRLKERGLSEKEGGKGDFSLIKGLLLSILAGVLLSFYHFAIAVTEPVVEIAAEHGAGQMEGNISYLTANTGAFVTSVIYALFLARKNKSIGEFVKLGEGAEKASLLANYVLAMLVGTLWYGQFFFYNLGHVRMGEDYGFTSWTIHMTMLVLFSNLTGVFFSEWKGCTRRTIAYVVAGLAVLMAAVLMLTYGNFIGSKKHPMDDYNIVWESPSKDYNGTMPIGNGDIGANVWVEEGGDLLFYISKTDAWSENARLLKIGKIRVRLTPNPFEKGCKFKQELDLKDGVIKITSAAKSADASVDLQFWIDANNPAIRVTGSATKETNVEVILEHWRTERKEATAGDRSFTGLRDRDTEGGGFAYPLFIEPDTIVDRKDNTILWYHRNKKNEHSVWQDTLKTQGLEGFMDRSSDPLLNLTFGALVRGDGLVSTSPTALKSATPTKTIDISIFPLTDQTATAKEWVEKVVTQTEEYSAKSPELVWTEHEKWWREFWDRSWINIDAKPEDDAYVVARGYALQNWITACGGRGNMPIKFNGSIFTVDGIQRYNKMYLGPDYRAWGPCYWWQNTRLPYWPMLVAGNYDMMKPLFKMYLDAMPLTQHKIKEYYNFDGAYFPETMFFWGTHANQDYGWNPEKDRHPDLIRGHHIRYEWQGGIELTAMMLQYYRHTLDSEFLNETVLPFAKEIVAFYDNRYERNEEGELVIFPANALEDVWNCTNPTPEVAGLRFILPQLAKLTSDSEQKKNYTRFLNEIPELETDISEGGKKYILPARKDVKRRGNCEKPECYAIFPYRLYGVGLDDLEIGKETFRLSPRSMNGQDRTNGWAQDPIFAACVGNVDEAKKSLVKRSKLFHDKSRFPAFWGPNFDWIPDQDHGGVNMIALQHMLLQTEPYSDKIHLCPAWPKEWNCSFKLHAPGKTIIQGKVKNGKVVDLKVTPKEREKDIINYLDNEK